MLKVKVLNYTPNGEELIASAAKLCYSNVGVEEIQEKQSPEDIDRFINMLVSLGHDSPLEHVSFTFAIEGVSRVLTHQLVRHRIASFSQQSQRYVTLDNFEYIIPPQIENNKIAKKIFLNAMEEDARAYDNIVNELVFRKIQKSENYKEFCDIVAEYTEIEDEDGQWSIEASYTDAVSGEDSSVFIGYLEMFKETYPKEYSKIEKSVIEDARYVFPNACETKIVTTMNTRSLLNFFKLRTCNRALWEIRELAIQMLREVKQIYPALFRTAGPGCVRGKCPEGTMTCGKITEVREKFKNM